MLALVALDRRLVVSGRSVPLVSIALGAIGGLHVLLRPSTGMLMVVAVAVLVGALCGGRARPAVGVCGASALGTVVIGWLATDQALLDLPRFLVDAIQVPQTLSPNQPADQPARSWNLLPTVGAVALSAWAVLATSRTWPPVHRRAALLLTALGVAVLIHEGLTGVDLDDAVLYLGLAVMLLGLPWPEALRPEGAFALGAALMMWLAATNPLPRDLVHVAASRESIEARLAAIRDSAATVEDARAALRSSLALEPRLIAEVAGRTLHAWPDQVAAAWAIPEAQWSPLPTVQRRLAKTDHLTALNGARLRGISAPERILRFTPDARFSDPDATFELACRYDEVARGASAHVLARVPSRCGQERLLKRVATTTGEAVDVPLGRPDELVYVRIGGLTTTFLERLRGPLIEADVRALQHDEVREQVPHAVADRRLLLSIPRRLDYSGRFAISPPIRRVAAVVDSGGGVSAATEISRRIQLEFTAVTLRRWGDGA
jgi:hypothetical protein